MKYELSNSTQNQSISTLAVVKKLAPLMAKEKGNLIIAFAATIINSGLNLLAPLLVAYAIDHYIQNKDYSGVLQISGILLLIFIGMLVASYLQTKRMGMVGQQTLFNLRNEIFNKLQELPVAFFNQNKVGDLISRINNDTDKLNQFFSRGLMQFVANSILIIGAGIFLIALKPLLGLAALTPALVLFFVTQFISPWIKKKNYANLKTVGDMSAEIQESLQNFKVIAVFNRRNYFRERFSTVNDTNYKAALSAGYANNIFTPTFGFASGAAQLIVLLFGIYLISTGEFTVGLLISFLLYVSRFYDPIRQLAGIWATFQTALAGWDRISDILVLTSDMEVIPTNESEDPETIIEFDHVSFHYPDAKDVIKNNSFKLHKGKSYALVGPTGGGKTTTASLMARLFDPTDGVVRLHGKDIRSYTQLERTKKIGFILQEPFLFSGTIKENILYGNSELAKLTNEQLAKKLNELNLHELLTRFDNNLDTVINGQTGMSLGQKQLIAFIRALLREPDILILDEATANIDTVTEKLLEEVLEKLPSHTTKVTIAHRLNTIENADVIYFVNAGEITRAGSLDQAIEMLLHNKRES